MFALGSTVLGISLPGQLITTSWAVRIGETFVATVLGAFAAFWISYAALVTGLAQLVRHPADRQAVAVRQARAESLRRKVAVPAHGE